MAKLPKFNHHPERHYMPMDHESKSEDKREGKHGETREKADKESRSEDRKEGPHGEVKERKNHGRG